jgi:hypothetical protein
MFFFERLAQGFEGWSGEFWELIEKEYPVVSERYFAGQ